MGSFGKYMDISWEFGCACNQSSAKCGRVFKLWKHWFWRVGGQLWRYFICLLHVLRLVQNRLEKGQSGTSSAIASKKILTLPIRAHPKIIRRKNMIHLDEELPYILLTLGIFFETISLLFPMSIPCFIALRCPRLIACEAHVGCMYTRTFDDWCGYGPQIMYAIAKVIISTNYKTMPDKPACGFEPIMTWCHYPNNFQM